jgi:hypothetical protein
MRLKTRCLLHSIECDKYNLSNFLAKHPRVFVYVGLENKEIKHKKGGKLTKQKLKKS